MPRFLQLLIGPELLWLIIYGGATALAKLNVPPSKTIDNLIVNSAYIIPVLAALTFSLWFIQPVEKNWLLLRVWIACLVGGHLALEKAMSAYSEQGPGIGTAYIMGMIFLIVALIAGSIFVKIRF